MTQISITVCRELKARVDYLEGLVNSIESDVDDLLEERNDRGKSPFRCPICCGSSFDEEGMMCTPCEGTGIVWG